MLRDGQRFELGGDTAERMAYEECEYDFVTRPGEKTTQIVFSTPAHNPEGGPILVDTVRLVAGNSMKLLKPDGKECLSATDFTALDAGVLVPKPNVKGFAIIYGTGSENKVVAEGNQGRKVLHIKSGPGTYMALGSALAAPLKLGGSYRLEVVARGQGRLDLHFWNLTPRQDNLKLTDEWKTYTLDFFVESRKQLNALPGFSVHGEMWLDRMSLKLAELTP
jgi:hypothetical protein